MISFGMIGLLTLMAQATVQQPVDSVGKFADGLANRVLKALPLHNSDLESTMLGKAGHLSIGRGVKHNSVIPYITRDGPSTRPIQSRWPGHGHNDKALLKSRFTHAAELARRAPRSLGISRGFFDSLFGGGASAKEDDEDIEYVEDPPVDLTSITQGTFLQGRKLARCYLASRDGWSPGAFHQKCDYKGPVIVVGQVKQLLKKPFWIGGFMPVELKSSDDYTNLQNDFLFRGDRSGVSIARKKGNGPVYDYERGGPRWGDDGLTIGKPMSPVGGDLGYTATGRGEMRSVTSKLGLEYETVDGIDSLLGKGVKTGQLEELEVYFSPEVARR